MKKLSAITNLKSHFPRPLGERQENLENLFSDFLERGKKTYIATSALILLSTPTFASIPEWLNDFTVGGGYGAVTGFNGQIGYRPKKSQLGLRFDINALPSWNPPFIFWNGNFNVDIRGVPVHFDLTRSNVDLKHFSAGLLLDYYFEQSDLFVSAGLYYSDATVHTDQTRTIIPNLWDVSATANMSWPDRFTPYIGIGYDWKLWKQLYLKPEFGVMYVGKPKTELIVSGIPQLTPEQLANANRGFSDKVSVAQFYPMVRLSTIWKF